MNTKVNDELSQLVEKAVMWLSDADSHISALPIMEPFAGNEIITAHYSRVRKYHSFADAILTSVEHKVGEIILVPV